MLNERAPVKRRMEMREFKTILFVVLFSVAAAFGIDFLIEILRAVYQC